MAKEEHPVKVTHGRRSQERWKDLEIWKIADELALSVYQSTRTFPNEELYGLTSQLRRAALSVPTNIVEGSSTMGSRGLNRYIHIAFASLAEVKYLLYFSRQLSYLTPENHDRLMAVAERLSAMLWRFSESIRSSPK